MAVNTVQVLINGQTVNLTYDSSTQKWVGTVTAPNVSSYNNNTGHYYPVAITATDVAGNTATKDDTDPTIGTSLRLSVKEKVAPVSTITAPTASQRLTNSQPTITWNVTDNDSGVNPATIGITIDSGTKITAGITKTAITGGYSCSYTPSAALSDGSHTIKVDAADFDGNNAVQKSVAFTIDTVAPSLSVTAPANNLVTNNASCTVTGVTNDATSSPCTVTVKLNSGAAQPATVAQNGSFSKAITLAAGTNTITVVSTDAAGKSTTVVRTVTLDTTPPVISGVTLTPNPVDAGATYVISVTVTD